MNNPGTLVLTRSDIASLMTFEDYLIAVEKAFQTTSTAGVLDLPGRDGMFHIKGASMAFGDRVYVAVKINGNFPENNSRYGLPTIQGGILLCDGIHGFPLAFMDSIEITINRTGAATALAAKQLARANSKTVTICGCGNQGRIQLLALKHVLPIEEAFVYDQLPGRASEFATQIQTETELKITPIQRLHQGAENSDIIVTCTTSRQVLLYKGNVREGSFVAGVGADSHDKQELDPALLSTNKLVTDVTDQCARIGDLHHAIESGLMKKEEVYAELAEIVTGKKKGRTSDSEITIFDSTGTAIQDVASAAIAYERALAQRKGTIQDLAR